MSSEVQNMKNEAFQNASFANDHFPDGTYSLGSLRFCKVEKKLVCMNNEYGPEGLILDAGNQSSIP